MGQRKIGFTMFRCSLHVEADNTLCCPIDLFRRYQQVVFRKRSEDLLTNPKADRLLTQLSTEEFILFGTVVEEAVKTVALGLLAREKPVTVVVDACGYWNRAAADLAMRRIVAKGGNVITVGELLKRKLNRRFRYPNGRGARAVFDAHAERVYGGRTIDSARAHPLGSRLSESARKARISKSNRKRPRRST
jgi:hypothetical protein